MIESQAAICASDRACTSVGSARTAGSARASIPIACRDKASASGVGAIESQRSTAWSMARIPLDRNSSGGVVSVAAGSRITVLGTKSG